MLEWWLQPPVDPLTKVHIFNYTNIERFISGIDDKIKVVDIGPFTYREKVEKTMMEYHDGTISFHVCWNLNRLLSPNWFYVSSCKSTSRVLCKFYAHC